MAKSSIGYANASLKACNVTRRPPELVPPVGPTPYEFKELSDIDDQDGLRFQYPIIQFYSNKDEHSGRSSSPLRGRDPTRVIKESVAKALVWYYPLAGRLREKQGRKLVVECNGEGIMFIEASADVTLKDFGDELHPPFPCLEELLYEVSGSTNILDTPLILIQVTMLKCGGFILALRFNHAITDGLGLVQFLEAAAELARGAEAPSIQPVWERHLLSARDPPRVTCEHREYEHLADPRGTVIPLADMVYKNFFFGPTEIAALKRLIPPHPSSTRTSTFEIIISCLWRCRTIALQPDQKELVWLMFFVTARPQFNPPLPTGFYGNASAFAGAASTASQLCRNPVGYALELVKNAKAKITQEYMMSLADYLVLNGRPHYNVVRNFIVPNLTQVGYDDTDFGWGSPSYGGPAEGGMKNKFDFVSHYIMTKNKEGEKRFFVTMCLPPNAMEIFTKELNGLFATSQSSSL